MNTSRRSAFLLAASAWVFVSLLNACEQTPTPTRTAASSDAVLTTSDETDLDRLQGFWEDGPVTVNITGNSLFFYERADHWYHTEFTLPAGTDPKQLHATIIKDSSGADDIVGVEVIAIFKFEDGKLILAAISSPPGSFDEEELTNDRYDLERAEPRAGRIGPPTGE